MILSLFKKKKIEVFIRHCYYSQASVHKKRPPGFSHEKCHENLWETANLELVNFTFILDTHFAQSKRHFLYEQKQFPLIEIDAGEEGKSFLFLLEYVLTQKFSDDTILYFLEDDYLHRQRWAEVLLEGFTLPEADYITLFDHRDKYFLEMYQELNAKLFTTKTCHWRTTPSTTNTYAMRMGTLKKDLSTHRKYSENHKISRDHEKFLDLAKQGRKLLSPIPGWSTHCETDYLSPCIDWSCALK